MKNIFFLLILSLLIVACQKEVSFGTDNPDGGGNTAGTLLNRMVSKNGADSGALEFTYSGDKVSGFRLFSTNNGTPIDVEQRVVRNSNGIIERVILKEEKLSQVGIDSLITYVKYNSSTGRYTAKISILEILGFEFKDSTALVYDAAGKMIAEMSYSGDGFGNYDPFYKLEYTYSGSNLASMKNFSWDDATGTYVQEQMITYGEHDNKPAAITMGNEAFIFTSPALYSANNATKSTTVENGTTLHYTATYMYNSFNKPISATGITQPGNISSSATYYYQ